MPRAPSSYRIAFGMAWVLCLVFDWIYFVLKLDSVWPASLSAAQGSMECKLTSEADPKQPSPASLSCPSPIPCFSKCTFLPLCSRLPFAKVPLFGVFIEVYAGHMRIGSEGRVREGGLEHGTGWAFRRQVTLMPARPLPVFSHIAGRTPAVCGRYAG